ncbi:54S ribosomal protein L7, mitochondrial [[Candida] railenensis]|uniref:Large ribosomal subunit protein uL5m n=1 Tax=[Candida] railenensis TaxID=45579 RepID=A0A9P0QSC5_9ASCO|nr:54S ribosomal protein L7, mitochondrial [[Candida] railenensis]
MSRLSIRSFSSSPIASKVGYSTVQPVHHLIPIKKQTLGKRFPELNIPKDDIRSPQYKPKDVYQDRVNEYYQNVLKSDLLLHYYEHDSEAVTGNKARSWGEFSPYAVYRRDRKPKGLSRATRDIKPVTPRNIPELTGISINLYNKAALEESWINISARLQLAQITNVKPKVVYNKSNVLPWKVRQGKECGCKVELEGRDMTRFLSTLVELVLPRIRTFKGIKDSSGDKSGNITFGLSPEEIKFFPEIENFQELFPNLFGFHLTFKTNAGTDERARTLLTSLGLPFYKEVKNVQ